MLIQRTDYRAGVGGIECLNCEAVSNTEVVVTFHFWVNPMYSFDDESLPIYYTTTPGEGDAPCVYVTPQNALVWKINTPLQGHFQVKYKITGLTAGTLYYFRPWVRIKGVKKGRKNFASPPDFPFPCRTTTEARNQPLVEIAKPYYQDQPEKGMIWIDLTEYITVPSYDVNNVDTNEDWVDSNYTTHRIVPRTKVSGKFNMLFTSVSKYNDFYNLIRLNRDMYGDGYTFLRVQVNNELDYDHPSYTQGGVSGAKCNRRAGFYFVKIDSNPLVEPYYGHFDKYQAITVSIEEA